MKALLLLTLAMIIASCGGKESEDFEPYPGPGGKGCCEKPAR